MTGSAWRLVRAAAAAAAVMMGCGEAAALPAQGATPVNNQEYAPMVRNLIKGAKSKLYIMLYQARYYPEYPDTITNEYSEDLIAAAKRGVDVRVIIDTGEWNPSGKNEYNTDFADRISTAGVKVWRDSGRDTSHQKVMLVDDRLSLVSSHNWTFYSLTNNNEVAVIIDSPQVNEWLRNYFMMIAGRGEPYANVRTAESVFEETGPTSGTISMSDLGSLEQYQVDRVEPAPNRAFYVQVRDAILGAKKEITVVQRSLTLYATRPRLPGSAVTTPLPGEPASQTNVLGSLLKDAAKRGIKVRVVLDRGDQGPNDDVDETAAYFAGTGVEVFGDDPAKQTHAKMMLVDDDKVILGSTNWTYPALEEGNEMSLLVVSPSLNKVYKAYVERVLQSGAPYKFEKTSIWDTSTTTATLP